MSVVDYKTMQEAFYNFLTVIEGLKSGYTCELSELGHDGHEELLRQYEASVEAAVKLTFPLARHQNREFKL